MEANSLTFRIGIKRQFRMLLPLIVKNGLIFGILYYLFGFSAPTYWVCLFIILIDVLPTVIVHGQYFLKNRKLEITFSSVEKDILINDDGKKLQYSFYDISKIVTVSSYGGGTGFYSFAEYRFSKIVFKDSYSLVLTCLLIDDFKISLSDGTPINEERKFKVVALI